MQPPIVADALGQLFNKQAVLEHLLVSKAAAGAAGAAAQPAPAVSTVTPAVASFTAAAATPGSIIAYSAAPAGASLDLAAACLRYENQQRAAATAAAAAAAGGGGSAAAATAQGSFSHIKSLKDVFVVQLTPNPDLQQKTAAAASAASNGQQRTGIDAGSLNPSCSLQQELPSPWMCPVTLQPCGSKQPFSALRSCGHVLSDKALTAITPPLSTAAAAAARRHNKAAHRASCSTAAAPPQPTTTSSQQQQQEDDGEVDPGSDACCCCCPVCEAAFDPRTDRVLINGSQQHMEAVRQQVQEAAVAKAEAKQKKRKRAELKTIGQEQRPAVLQLPAGGG